MLVISQNDNSEELKKLKLETNFNAIRYGNIPIGECFSYERKFYIKTHMEYLSSQIGTAICLDDGIDKKFFAEAKVFPVDAVVLTD